MNKETTDIFAIASAIILFILLGVGLIFASRWSRRKNAELKSTGHDSQLEAINRVFKETNPIDAVKSYFSSSVSNPVAFVAKTLAAAAIAVFCAFLVFACYALIRAI